MNRADVLSTGLVDQRDESSNHIVGSIHVDDVVGVRIGVTADIRNASLHKSELLLIGWFCEEGADTTRCPTIPIVRDDLVDRVQFRHMRGRRDFPL